ncbi:MAG: phospho-sugar mutase, partial [Clostridia bacterium]|nr:phospho-sugar mutase [Clostridia bacterium]
MLKIYQDWLARTEAYPELHAELEQIKGNEKEIEDRFYRELAFGTGGLRGVLGAGTNRMNVFTVGRATFGLAAYIHSVAKDGSVVIAYDSRNMSKEFASLAAEIMSARGVRAYLFSELMPTPVLSYAVRHLKATAGIVITASHNPKEYNGYKVYNEHGCQITDEAAKRITEYIQKADYFEHFTPNKALIQMLGDEVLASFINDISSLSLYDGCAKHAPTVVYTPLNGTGNKPVRRVLDRIGVRNVAVVPEQEQPNGNFPTCPYPNPEERVTLTLATDLAAKTGAELVLATDPDADRVGIAVREKNGEYRLLNGNETGVLLENYILTRKKEAGTLPARPVVVKTIVTSDMATDIAAAYGAEVKEVLTGFKYIGETIDRLDDPARYVFGLEESYGYLCGTHARDKDAVSACMMIAEMAAYYRAQGKLLTEVLEELFKTYGYYAAGLVSKSYPGKTGKEQMNALLASLRKAPWTEICGKKVNVYKDYSAGIDGLPASDVLSFSGDGFK